MDVNGQLNSAAALSPGRTPIFITQEAGGAIDLVWTLENTNLYFLPGLQTQIFRQAA